MGWLPERKKGVAYDPDFDYNRQPACTCIHPENMHDRDTGRCIATNPTFGECPCEAGRHLSSERDNREAAHAR